jgi:nucleotide-binding universal stress UspA family protein
MEMPAPSAPVVVGVDGSQQSVRALRWAAFEALHRHAELVAVHAYGRRRSSPHRAAGAPPDAQAAARLDTCLRAAFADRPPVTVRPVCDSRGPVPALLAHSEGAALLVLTARPHPSRRGAAQGTVVRRCLYTATCPVVVMLTPASVAMAAESA